MDLNFYPYDLQFRHPFKIATGTRNLTRAIFVELSHEGITGYGEAVLPPYLPESQESVLHFLSKVKPEEIWLPFSADQAIDYFFSIDEDNWSAKAALDMAAYDLYGKLNQLQTYRIWTDGPFHAPLNTFTLGMDSPSVLSVKLKEAENFQLLKVKLGGPFDNLIMKTMRELTNKPICVDVNQGWTDEYFALDMIEWLAEQNVVFIEQPLPKTEKKKQAWLKAKSPLPLIGDESIQGYGDLVYSNEYFHGINIKLMKCGGLREAYRMIREAKKLDLKILIGCMSESSCGVSAAAQLAPFADWTDLDGPLLITNDPFDGIIYQEGKIILPERYGCGVSRK